MANLITTSATWTGKQVLEAFIKPLFIGQNPLQAGFRVIPNVQSVYKLNYFASFNKILKAYSKGFTGSNFGDMTQRSLTVYEMKAEAAQDANAFYQTVYEQALNKGVAWNDMTGTVLENIILGLFRDAVASDVHRLAWLADVYKETLTSTTYGDFSGTADTAYNAFDGWWELIFDNAATTPTSSQIQRHALTDTTTAQVSTVLVNGGASNPLRLVVGNVDYETTYNSSYDTTCDDFVTAHAAALLLRGITLTKGTTATLVFTATRPGQPFTAVTFHAGSYCTGTVTPTANVAPSALGTDEVIGDLRSVYEKQPAVLRNIPNEMKRLYMDKRSIDNYIESLEDSGTYTEWGKTALVDGIQRITYRGIPIIEHNWGQYLDDYPHANGYLPVYPHRFLLTVPENLVMGIDAQSEFNQMEFWYNKDEQENRFRMQLKMGFQYVHNALMVAAY